MDKTPNIETSASSANIIDMSKAFLVSNNKQEWIIDTMATNHIGSELTLLKENTIVKSANPKKYIYIMKMLLMLHIQEKATSQIEALYQMCLIFLNLNLTCYQY